MDRLVRLFSGGIVKENGEFERMREQIARFDIPSSFDDLCVQVSKMFKVGEQHSELCIRGRFDVGDKRAHYVVMPIESDNDWIFYKDLVKDSQVGCAELVVEVRDSVTAKDSNIEVDDEEEEYDVDMSNGPDSEGEGNELNKYDNCHVNNGFDEATFEEEEEDEDDISEGSEEHVEEMREGITQEDNSHHEEREAVDVEPTNVACPRLMAERKHKVEIRYPTESCVDAPVPPALPVPNCECGIPAEERWPLCDFQEYIYAPKMHWYYTEEHIKEFESGKEKWPCERAPRTRCKCGSLARRGVVPTELGYGWYCGNSYGDFWEGRTYDWETFPKREELMQKLSNQAEPLKTRTTLERNNKIRRKYKVPLPDERILYDPVAIDQVAEHGMTDTIGLECEEELITFWRKNRSKYSEEKISEAVHRACDFTKVFPKGTWEHHFQWFEALRRGIDVNAVRMKAEEAKIAEEAQLEAMKALVADLPVHVGAKVGTKMMMIGEMMSF
ncbi:hypothetical protein C2845_PM11G05700 [Panicum miliaceum]|uniref:Transposase MuDR plant domain-containing protein n=1 Tax=Panicum miliaceum TaxID=4540 RepID=A0A3L6RRK5_PANMI|nr:hypothetical protein C2845_PM11G05700 [Panicum miliaceum]